MPEEARHGGGISKITGCSTYWFTVPIPSRFVVRKEATGRDFRPRILMDRQPSSWQLPGMLGSCFLEGRTCTAAHGSWSRSNCAFRRSYMVHMKWVVMLGQSFMGPDLFDGFGEPVEDEAISLGRPPFLGQIVQSPPLGSCRYLGNCAAPRCSKEPSRETPASSRLTRGQKHTVVLGCRRVVITIVSEAPALMS